MALSKSVSRRGGAELANGMGQIRIEEVSADAPPAGFWELIALIRDMPGRIRTGSRHERETTNA